MQQTSENLKDSSEVLTAAYFLDFIIEKLLLDASKMACKKITYSDGDPQAP